MKLRVGMTVIFAGREAVEGDSGYETLEDFLDSVMEELLALGFVEPSIGGSLSGSQVEISVDVESDTPEKGFIYGASSIRAAIHAAHGGTPDWPSRIGTMDVRPVEDEATAELQTA